MPNLSNMLGDVYGRGDDPDPEDARGTDAEEQPTPDARDSAEAVEVEAADGGPDWASDDRLDAAFGDWTAGELPGSEPDARERLEHLGEEAAAAVAATEEATVEEPPAEESVVAEEPVAEPPRAEEPNPEQPRAEEPEPAVAPSEPQVRAVAAGELDHPPASPPKPAPDDIRMSDFTSVAHSPTPDPTPEPLEPGRPSPHASWHRGDDDILPDGGRRGLSRLLSR